MNEDKRNDHVLGLVIQQLKIDISVELVQICWFCLFYASNNIEITTDDFEMERETIPSLRFMSIIVYVTTFASNSGRSIKYDSKCEWVCLQKSRQIMLRIPFPIFFEL